MIAQGAANGASGLVGGFVNCGSRLGIIAGIVIGVVLSLLLLIGRASNPRIRELGKAPDSDAYLDLTRHDGLTTTPGILIVRVDGPLFFADANRFLQGVRDLTNAADEPVEAIVIDAEAISQTDTDGADVLIELASEAHRRGGVLALARVESSILDLWRRAGLIEVIGPELIFHQVSAAVTAVGRRVGLPAAQASAAQRKPTFPADESGPSP